MTATTAPTTLDAVWSIIQRAYPVDAARLTPIIGQYDADTLAADFWHCSAADAVAMVRLGRLPLDWRDEELAWQDQRMIKRVTRASTPTAERRRMLQNLGVIG